MANLPYSRIICLYIITQIYVIFNRKRQYFLLIFLFLSPLRSKSLENKGAFYCYLPKNTLHKSFSSSSRQSPGSEFSSKCSPPTESRRSSMTGFPREASILLT